MVYLRRVRGRSMLPTLHESDYVLFRRQVRYVVGDVVLVRHDTREIVKRITRVDGSAVYLVGDNTQESTDSRHYGMVPKSAIIGSIMTQFHFPKAVKPPKLAMKSGVVLGRIAALILIAMAVIHLFRIDTLIPILDQNLPGGLVWATWAGVLIILSEVFAIPFLFRLQLSPLAQIKSGAFVVLAPLWWLLITIWSYGSPYSTGQLGEFVDVQAVLSVLVLNVLWVGFSYYTLYALGYNNLTLGSVIKGLSGPAKKSTGSKSK